MLLFILGMLWIVMGVTTVMAVEKVSASTHHRRPFYPYTFFDALATGACVIAWPLALVIALFAWAYVPSATS